MTIRIQPLLIVHLFEEDARLLVKMFSQQRVFLETCFIETTVVSTNKSYFHNMLRVTYNTLRIFLKE